jgi:hypothetical protein
MSDWIKEAVERIRKQDVEQKRREEIELSRAKLMKEKAPLLWQQLRSQIETDVRQLNAAFQGEMHRQVQIEEFHPETLSICKSAGPLIKLHLHYDAETYTISYEFEAEWGNPPCRERENGTMEFVTADGNVYFGEHHKLPEDVSRQMLGMFINAEGF